MPCEEDEHSWEEEEDEEDEEDVEFSDDSDDKLGTTNKEVEIRRRLEEEREEEEEEEEDEEDEEEVVGTGGFLPGSRVRLLPEQIVRTTLGVHWHDYMVYCCGKVGVVHRNHSTDAETISQSVFVTFATPTSFLISASFTLPQSLLSSADRRRSRANTSTVHASSITPPQHSLLASTATIARKNSR